MKFFSPFLELSGTEPTITGATKWPVIPARDDNDDDCGAIAGMLGKGNGSTRKKPAPVPLCPPQIPQGLNRARTLAAND
jgi:hypothetical protein